MVMIFTGQIYQHFLRLEKSTLTYLINKEDEINEDGCQIFVYYMKKCVEGGKTFGKTIRKDSCLLDIQEYCSNFMKNTGKFCKKFNHKSKYW